MLYHGRAHARAQSTPTKCTPCTLHTAGYQWDYVFDWTILKHQQSSSAARPLRPEGAPGPSEQQPADDEGVPRPGVGTADSQRRRCEAVEYCQHLRAVLWLDGKGRFGVWVSCACVLHGAVRVVLVRGLVRNVGCTVVKICTATWVVQRVVCMASPRLIVHFIAAVSPAACMHAPCMPHNMGHRHSHCHCPSLRAGLSFECGRSFHKWAPTSLQHWLLARAGCSAQHAEAGCSWSPA